MVLESQGSSSPPREGLADPFPFCSFPCCLSYLPCVCILSPLSGVSLGSCWSSLHPLSSQPPLEGGILPFVGIPFPGTVTLYVALLDRWSHGWLCPPSKLQTFLQLHWDTLQMFWRAQEFGSLRVPLIS